MIKRLCKILILLFLCLCAHDIYSQKPSQKMLDEAKKLYLSKQYAKALPELEKAYKSDPKSPAYNQWYGNCLLETGKLADSEKYLQYAASKNVQEASRSLGKLYFLQYKFEESADSYQKYIDLLKKKKETKDIPEIESLKNTSLDAARMLSHCEDIQIIDSVIVNKKDFLSAYEFLSKESGTLSELNSLLTYENQLGDKRYYAKVNKDKKYRIYSQNKLMNDWSEEMMLNIPSEPVEDINYPFVLSDGVTIYYASTKQGSIGGYDLFVTRFNSSTESYFKPEQLGMPFNSPYNDYMMAIDEYNEIGYFATDRFQPVGKVVVYAFIPNAEKVKINNMDAKYLQNRAMITSIKDSQRKGVNYKAKLTLIKNEQQKDQEKEAKEFEFVINDNIVYYKLDDFTSHAARQFFTMYQEMSKQLLSLKNQLDEKRKSYMDGNPQKKKSLTASILEDEEKMIDLTNRCKDLEIKTRNTEIKHLRANQ